jgi:hypothetical protein
MLSRSLAASVAVTVTVLGAGGGLADVSAGEHRMSPAMEPDATDPGWRIAFIGDAVSIRAVNNRGEVIGYDYAASPMETAFRWSEPGGPRPIGPGDPVAINASGHVAANASLADFGRAYLWDARRGVQQVSSPVPGRPVHVTDLNATDVVVGQYTVQRQGRTLPRAFRWSPRRGAVPLNGQGEAAGATAVNTSAEVTGYRGSEAVRWGRRGGLHMLGVSGWGVDINRSGVVVGVDPGGAVERAWRWTPGRGVKWLEDAGGCSSAAEVGRNGRAAGYVCTGDGTAAAVWTSAGTLRQLPSPPDVSSCRGEDINDQGDVSGVCEADGGPQAAWWSADGKLHSLGTLLPVSDAQDINNRRQVVGNTSEPGYFWSPQHGSAAATGP